MTANRKAGAAAGAAARAATVRAKPASEIVCASASKAVRRHRVSRLFVFASQAASHEKKAATRKANATGGEGAWTDGEENKFRTAVGRFGRDWVRVAAAVGTRDSDQCADFAVGKDYVPPARRPRRDRARTRR